MLLVAETAWWLFFWTALGLCVGSFLNVVIFRLPRGQSVLDPLWSQCPHCLSRIAWYDNIPLFSFSLLGGKCRRCACRISARYPMIEALNAVVVLVLFDAFFVGIVRRGLNAHYGTLEAMVGEPSHLSWSMWEDWPIFLAHVILFACLLSMAAIDLTEYWVDIRFTTVAAIAGFVLHTIWTPSHSVTTASGASGWHRPHEATVAGAFGAMVGLALLWTYWRTRMRHMPPMPCEPADQMLDESGSAPQGTVASTCDEPAAPDSTVSSGSTDRADSAVTATHESISQVNGEQSPAAPIAWPSSLGVFVALAVVLAGLCLSVGLANMGMPTIPHTVRALVPTVLVFILIIVEASIPRQMDDGIVEAIDAERFSARRVALVELIELLPALLLAAAGIWLTLSSCDSQGTIRDWLQWRPLAGWSGTGQWRPLLGLATAVSGFVIGGAIGWTVRIVFTFVFGKEAFGLGDIHIMAAAGAVAGWPVVLLGFFVTIFIALFAWVVTLPIKRTRAIPLVPWLAMGYLVVVVFYEDLLRFGPIENAIELYRMMMHQNSQP